ISDWTQSARPTRNRQVFHHISDMLCTTGVSLGTCSVPLLYTVELQEIVTRHALSPHLYADDTQIYGSYRPTDINVLQAGIDEVADWMRVNRLQLNTA